MATASGLSAPREVVTLPEAAPRLRPGPAALRRLLGATAAVVLLGAAGWVAFHRGAAARDVLQLPPGLLLLAFALRCGAYLLSVAAMHAVVSADVPGLSFREYLRVASRATALAYVASSAGGIGYKTAYFRLRHDLPVLRFIGMTAVTSLLGITAGGLVGLGGLAAVRAHGVAVAPLCWTAAGAGIALGAGPLLLARSGWDHRLPRGRLARTLGNVVLAPATAVRCFALTLLQALASGGALGVIFAAFRPDATAFISGMVADALTAAARVVMLTPRNVGINEWLVGIVGRAAGMSLETALAASMLYLTIAVASTLTVFAASNLPPLRREPT